MVGGWARGWVVEWWDGGVAVAAIAMVMWRYA